MRCTGTRKCTEEFLSRKWRNEKEGWLASNHYAVLTIIIYRSRKIKLNSSGSKNETVSELNGEGTPTLTDRGQAVGSLKE